MIITEGELNFLLNLIEANKSFFIENGENSKRYFLPLPRDQNIPKLFFDIKERILKKENILSDYIDEYVYGDYIGYILDGGKIHLHKDPTIPGYEHVRFNLFISVPQSGGYPIYNNLKIPVKVGDYVKCNASKEYHECDIVNGNTPRIVISYGIYLKK